MTRDTLNDVSRQRRERVTGMLIRSGTYRARPLTVQSCNPLLHQTRYHPAGRPGQDTMRTQVTLDAVLRHVMRGPEGSEFRVN